MKISFKSTIYSIAAATLLVGCGGGGSIGNGATNNNGSTSETPTVSKKISTVQASDAYVVHLITPATLKAEGKEFNTTRVEANGTIVFNLPDDLNLTNAKIKIPADAIVDADGDGNYSAKDQTIRMALYTKGVDSVANPLATVALEKNDTKAYTDFKNFDPVKAKEKLIDNPDNGKLKALVAVNDAIASLVKEANSTNPKAILRDIKLNEIKQFVDNNSSNTDIADMTITTIQKAATNAAVNENQIADKTSNILKVIEKVHTAMKNKKIKSRKDALKAVLAISDADVNMTVIDKAIADGNITAIRTHIRDDVKVLKDRAHNKKKGYDGIKFPGKGSMNGDNNTTHIPGMNDSNKTHIPGKGNMNGDDNATHFPGMNDNNKTHIPGKGNMNGDDNSTHIPGMNNGMNDSNRTHTPGKGNMNGDDNATHFPGMNDNNRTHIPGKGNMNGDDNSTHIPGMNNGMNDSNRTHTPGQGNMNGDNNATHFPGMNADDNATHFPGMNDNNKTHIPGQGNMNGDDNATHNPGMNADDNSTHNPGMNDSNATNNSGQGELNGNNNTTHNSNQGAINSDNNATHNSNQGNMNSDNNVTHGSTQGNMNNNTTHNSNQNNMNSDNNATNSNNQGTISNDNNSTNNSNQGNVNGNNTTTHNQKQGTKYSL